MVFSRFGECLMLRLVPLEIVFRVAAGRIIEIVNLLGLNAQTSHL